MANRLKGEVGFKAGGADYVLLLDVNALCELEARFDGKSAVEVFQAMQDGVRFTDLRAIFAVGLRVGETDAGVIMQEIGLETTADLLSQAFQAAFPEASEGGNPPKAAG